MSVREVLTDPLTVALSSAAALMHMLGVGWIEAVVAVVWTQLPTIFTVLSISGFTLAPELSWLPEEPLTAAALVVAGLYVVKLSDDVIDQIQERLDR